VSDTATTPGVHPAILTHDVKRVLVAAGGQIWHIDQHPDGLLIRAEIGPVQIRLLLPRPGTIQMPQPTAERGSACHVVASLEGLKTWLQQHTTP
jgi:hypothetical protein